MLILKPSIYLILFYELCPEEYKKKKHWKYENTSKERNNTLMIT